MKNEIIIFENQNIKLEVNVKDETVWLSLDQMAKLFGRDRTVITRHINNIFKTEELDKTEVCAKFAHTTQHGFIAGKTQTRQLDYYNLDMIISVGYRINSKQGIAFRKWANGVLKDYLLKGYVANQKRLEYLEKAVKLIDIASRNNEDSESKELLNVIAGYTKALDLLDEYDHRTLKKQKGDTSEKIITYDDCINIIKELRFNEESDIFGLERNKGLESIINNIYQSFDGNDVYPSIQEKGANFLYLIVKNHVFIDGNKRIAATLFIYFLFYYDILYKDSVQVIDNNTLTAVTLLIAQSNPKEKEIIIDLVTNFLS